MQTNNLTEKQKNKNTENHITFRSKTEICWDVNDAFVACKSIYWNSHGILALGKARNLNLPIVSQNPTRKGESKELRREHFFFPFLVYDFPFLRWKNSKEGSQWDHPTCHRGVTCKKPASWVGLTMPGRWVPFILSKSAISTYLSYFSGSASFIWLNLLFFFSGSLGHSVARLGSHRWPKRDPLARNSWARYPANSRLEGHSSEPLALLVDGSDPVIGLSGFTNLVVGLLGMKGLGLGMGLSLLSSLSLRLLRVVLGVDTRRGGKRIVLVIMAIWPHATSAHNTPRKTKSDPNLKRRQNKFS